MPAQPVTVHYLPAGRLADAWQDDEFDVLDGSLPPEELAAANQGGGDYRVQESAANVTEVLAFDTAGDGPMAEPAARRAAAALLDREALARHVRHDRSRRSTPSSPWATPDTARPTSTPTRTARPPAI